MPQDRGFVGSKHAIELDGIHAGWVWSAEGGQPVSEVVTEKMGPDHIAKKHLGGIKYEDLSFTVATGMSKGFYEWIKKSFDHETERKNGAIITADFNHNEVSRLNFFLGLICEFGLPGLDAASKDAAKMSLKVTPEYTREVQGRGPNIGGSAFAIDPRKQKQWLVSNFRLSITGLERGCSRVNKIESLVLKQKIQDSPMQESRDFERLPAALEVPNLVVTLPQSHADEFYAWHKKFAIDGVCDDDAEKTGTLEYLAPDLKTVLFTVTFSHLGIFKLSPEKLESGSEQIRRVKAEMYCEEMSFKYSNSTWA